MHDSMCTEALRGFSGRAKLIRFRQISAPLLVARRTLSASLLQLCAEGSCAASSARIIIAASRLLKSWRPRRQLADGCQTVRVLARLWPVMSKSDTILPPVPARCPSWQIGS